MSTEFEPTILVVDDTEDNLDLLEFALKRKPVKLLRATSGKMCLTMAEEFQPDLILLDIQMPEMDGFETLKLLRVNPRSAKIPVIFLTAQRKDAESIATGLALGADQYLTKPIDTEELLVRTKMLIRLKKAEAELEQTKSDFMAMMVHDLRSPLIGVKSVVELILESAKGQPLDEDYFELLRSAKTSAVKLLDLISDFLDVSKYEAGNISFDTIAVPVNRIIDPVTRQMMLPLRQKNVTLEVRLPNDLPNVLVDPSKTEQVVMNFISNSLKFTPGGGTITVSGELVSVENPIDASILKRYVRINITDTGMGIAKEELVLLFTRYKQTSSAKKVKAKGTGLGLVICKLIVEAQGGIVTAQSTPGKETTFSFTLPVAE